MPRQIEQFDRLHLCSASNSACVIKTVYGLVLRQRVCRFCSVVGGRNNRLMPLSGQIRWPNSESLQHGCIAPVEINTMIGQAAVCSFSVENRVKIACHNPINQVWIIRHHLIDHSNVQRQPTQWCTTVADIAANALLSNQIGNHVCFGFLVFRMMTVESGRISLCCGRTGASRIVVTQRLIETAGDYHLPPVKPT